MVGSYSVIQVKYIHWGEISKEADDFFISREDGLLKILGSRPSNLSYLFPERECITGNEGELLLPSGRSLSSLVEGDVLSVKKDKESVYNVVYCRRR
ncbi:hypothetical protein HY639_05015 [Candidatus Woesearchaeota archaeon]|nr:hypothetical protein [Candidatus Woesearchaeota archaeon]